LEGGIEMWLIWVIEGRMDWSLVGWMRPLFHPSFFAKSISSVITKIVDVIDFLKKRGMEERKVY
jgi:hypothetical protein